MSKCAAINCSNEEFEGSEKSFHLFPLGDPDLLQEWIINMKRANFKPSEESALCSDHFEEDCFDTTGTDLIPGAVPTIFDISLQVTDEMLPSVVEMPEDKQQAAMTPAKRGRCTLNCVAYQCRNYLSDESRAKGITFHRFPFSRPALLKRWVTEVHRTDWYPSKYSRICSEHFTAADFELFTGSIRRLRKDAYPSVFSFLPQYQKSYRKKNIIRQEDYERNAATINRAARAASRAAGTKATTATATVKAAAVYTATAAARASARAAAICSVAASEITATAAVPVAIYSNHQSLPAAADSEEDIKPDMNNLPMDHNYSRDDLQTNSLGKSLRGDVENSLGKSLRGYTEGSLKTSRHEQAEEKVKEKQIMSDVDQPAESVTVVRLKNRVRDLENSVKMLQHKLKLTQDCLKRANNRNVPRNSAGRSSSVHGHDEGCCHIIINLS